MNRQEAERRSATLLLYLRGLPRWLLPVVLAALLIAGLAVRGWGGAVALCLVAAFLSWLAFLAWPRVSASGRLARVAVVALVLAVAAFQASH